MKVLGLAVVGALMTVAGVKASDPVGIYALVERVVLEPNDSAPKNARIYGAFTAAVQPETRSYKPEEAYGPIGRGYLYFTCPADKGPMCVAEWNDLKSVAGKGEVVGFGGRWTRSKPTLHAISEAATSPDIYEMNIGVVKIGKYGEYPTLVAALKAAIAKK